MAQTPLFLALTVLLSNCSQPGEPAIGLARTAVGLPQAPASATRVPAEDAQVPFMPEELSGKQVWKVVIDHRPGWDLKPAVHGFSAWLTDDGRLLRVASLPLRHNPVPKDLFEGSLSSSRLQFTALFDRPPAVPLLNLLKGQGNFPRSEPLPGLQAVDAYLAQVPAHPGSWTWLVRYRGFSTLVCPPPGPGRQENPCTRHDTAWLLTADADSGQVFGYGTIPDHTCERRNGRPFRGAFAEDQAGKWVCYSPQVRDRNPSHGRFEYQDGHLVRAVGFHPQGRMRIEHHYEAGSKLKSTTWWYGNGQRQQVVHYIPTQITPSWHDPRHGLAQGWDRDGKLIWQGEYRDGKPWSGTFPTSGFLHGDRELLRFEEGERLPQTP